MRKMTPRMDPCGGRLFIYGKGLGGERPADARIAICKALCLSFTVQLLPCIPFYTITLYRLPLRTAHLVQHFTPCACRLTPTRLALLRALSVPVCCQSQCV